MRPWDGGHGGIIAIGHVSGSTFPAALINRRFRCDCDKQCGGAQDCGDGTLGGARLVSTFLTWVHSENLRNIPLPSERCNREYGGESFSVWRDPPRIAGAFLRGWTFYITRNWLHVAANIAWLEAVPACASGQHSCCDLKILIVTLPPPPSPTAAASPLYIGIRQAGFSGILHSSRILSLPWVPA